MVSIVLIDIYIAKTSLTEKLPRKESDHLLSHQLFYSRKENENYFQGCTTCGSLAAGAARKWRENEKMKRKWRENEEMESKWRENEEEGRE